MSIYMRATQWQNETWSCCAERLWYCWTPQNPAGIGGKEENAQFADSPKALPLGFGARGPLQDYLRGEGGVTEPVTGLLKSIPPFP